MLAGANENTRAPSGGNREGENPSNIYMMSAHADITTRSHDHGEAKSLKAKGDPHNVEPLHIERLAVEPIPWMSKGFKKHTTINPNAKAAQN